MSLSLDRKPAFAVFVVLIGVAYYAGAALGVHLTVMDEGISVIWPPNAILLAAFLILPYRRWVFVALAALVAEVIAALPVFPLWAALGFNLVNLLEASLAALLIRHVTGGGFDFDRLRNGVYFLLFGPLLSSSLAGLLGAGIYRLLGAESAYFELWLIWWFGDALGLLLLTPFVVVLWRCMEGRLPRYQWRAVAEALALWLVILALGFSIFIDGQRNEFWFLLVSFCFVLLGIVAAVRLGVMGATVTVMLIALLAMEALQYGIYPYAVESTQLAVWLTQEYLAVIVLVSVGLAILLREIREQAEALRGNERTLQAVNRHLEERVQERTLALEEANQALQDANEQLALTIATDELTGVSSRRYFYSEAQRELSRLQRDREAAALIMIDLDNFKGVNDSFGHEAGDNVLRAVPEPLRQSVRPRDLLGRIGGEEFLILLSGVSQKDALNVAERIRAALESMVIEYEGREIRISASCGVAIWDGEATLDTLVREADSALYRAKHKGRNRVELPPAHQEEIAGQESAE